MLQVFANSSTEVHGRAITLAAFAEILLRGSAVDYTTESDANGIECKHLLRHAWLFVREQLAADRFFSQGPKAVDPVFKYIDSIIAMLE
jgi:hypothetical protein